MIRCLSYGVRAVLASIKRAYLASGSASVQLELPETLRRLREHIHERNLDWSDLLDPVRLATRAALPEETVRCLLEGDDPPDECVRDRVTSRIQILTQGRLDIDRKRTGDLVSEVAQYLGISSVRAQQLLTGEKRPHILLLRGLADFFNVQGGEEFFTAPAAEALNRILLPELRKFENLDTDPLAALMTKYGVISTDLRCHGAMTPEQLEELLRGILRPGPQDGQQ